MTSYDAHIYCIQKLSLVQTRHFVTAASAVTAYGMQLRTSGFSWAPARDLAQSLARDGERSLTAGRVGARR